MLVDFANIWRMICDLEGYVFEDFEVRY